MRLKERRKPITILFIVCFLIGIFFCLLAFLIGDWIGDIFQIDIGFPLLQPVILFGGLTTFGGVGFVLTNWTELAPKEVIIYALATAFICMILLYLLVIRPADRTENSMGFQLQDLVGKEGEVWISIPAKGFGEVLITMTGGNTNQIAASMDNTPILEGTRVVVKEVRDQVLYVQPARG